MGLSKDEVARYSRHLVLPEVGVKGQEKLKNSSVLLVGAGGLGAPLALYLTAAGVGRIGIVDFDVVDSSNLQRQILHGESMLGKSKLESAKARLLDLNSFVQLDLINDRLSSENALDIFKDYDVVADGTDNFPTRYLVNDACVLSGKPNVYGSIFRFEGQVSVFNYEGGPCYRCLYPNPPPPGLVPSCAEGGVLGVLPGVIGSLQANEVIKVLLGIGKVLSNRLLLYDALKMAFRTLTLRRDSDCPLCGTNPSVTSLIDYEVFCGVPLNTASNNERKEDNRVMDEVTATELKVILDKQEDVTLIDVRESYERDISKIDQAISIPLGELSEKLDSLDKAKSYVIHCKTGGRSAQAANIMLEDGFDHVANLVGGINSWAEDVDLDMAQY